ncbi:NTP hydrolase p-loop-containing [Desulfonema limicola]|uniref:NTP hydrolase p-loop-containing n=1 Tax=Desulfonema limicola TaxID=45656 RepID=A0A975GEF8_9BACT|nr:AAA family ATPase [Desulfonema limicola]QTA78191.1 NTP hydrolase p-loop-containing [Desulfonema limicola]
MQNIKITNFGPVKHVDLDVNEFIIFIGPQASGKSTISKCIYFFKSLKDDLLKYIIESIDNKSFDNPIISFSKKIRAKFLDFWGPTFHLTNLTLEYQYKENIYLSIGLKHGYVNPVFSQSFIEYFNSIISEAESYNEKISKRDIKFMSSSDFFAAESEKRNFLNRIENLISELFGDNKDLVFIPAGRSLLATVSEQIQSIHSHKLDYLMRSFADRIINSKPFFSKSLYELVTDKKKYTQEKIEFNNVYFAQKIIEDILKGEYRFDSEGEKLFFDSQKYVKLNYASSGQQEVIWILLLIFLLILEKKQVFIVFEEPEAHLYPEAQKDIVELISLLSNVKNNQIIITTHSPYILSSLNNLLYAYNIGQKKTKETKNIVDKRLWVNPKKLNAFFVSEGCIKNIIDDEFGLIKSEAIDSASNIINNIFNLLFDLDD